MSSPCHNIDKLFSDGLPARGAYDQVHVICIFYDLILGMDKLEIIDPDDEGGRAHPRALHDTGFMEASVDSCHLNRVAFFYPEVRQPANYRSFRYIKPG